MFPHFVRALSIHRLSHGGRADQIGGQKQSEPEIERVTDLSVQREYQEQYYKGGSRLWAR